MVAGLMDDPAAREATDAMVRMPLGGHLQAGQVAALLAWLTSEENTHLCGQTVYIDGGSDVLLRGDDVWAWNDPVERRDRRRLAWRGPPASARGRSSMSWSCRAACG